MKKMFLWFWLNMALELTDLSSFGYTMLILYAFNPKGVGGGIIESIL